MNKKTTNYWTTADGRKIPYPELTDDHLKNIIKDGYRNPHILKEALSRKFKVPKRPVDSLSLAELNMWIEALSSSALSGNEYAQNMLNLWGSDEVALFMFKLNKLIENSKNN